MHKKRSLESSETPVLYRGRTVPTFIIFDVQGSVHRMYIRFDIFPTRYNFTQFIYFWKTALHVSGGIFTHHQEHINLYLQYLVLVNCKG